VKVKLMCPPVKPHPFPTAAATTAAVEMTRHQQHPRLLLRRRQRRWWNRLWNFRVQQEVLIASLHPW
jgi:hypothetical protein